MNLERDQLIALIGFEAQKLLHSGASGELAFDVEYGHDMREEIFARLRFLHGALSHIERGEGSVPEASNAPNATVGNTTSN